MRHPIYINIRLVGGRKAGESKEHSSCAPLVICMIFTRTLEPMNLSLCDIPPFRMLYKVGRDLTPKGSAFR